MARTTILTCNIRCFGAEDGDNGWEHRKDLCADVIRAQAPDIVCFQEMWAEPFADLCRALPGYDTYAMADEPVGRRPQNAIFYRADRYARISAGGYWLSEAPHVAGSSSWDSACVRLANWIRLEDRGTQAEFRVVNTHLDHVSQAAREHQAGLIAEDASAYPATYPQILTGDMNCDFRNSAIRALEAAGWTDTYAAVHGAGYPGHTYHEFQGPRHKASIGKMDWIFMRGGIDAVGAAVLTDSRNGRYPSDHYFVSATVRVARETGPRQS